MDVVDETPARLGSIIDDPASRPLREACDELATRANELFATSAATIADYTMMLRIRRMEEELHRLRREGLIAANIHQGIGQEATTVACVGALQRSDWLTATYRGRGHAVAKGVALGPIFAETLQRETGVARGRAGAMHMADADCNLLFESAIVGGAVPLAVGAALAASRLDTGAIAMTFFGEGATAQGATHEALNLAGAWHLPVVFVLENNGYSEMTPAAMTTALRNFSWRALGHGLPALSADGNSIPAMRAASRAAVEWARAGRGPVMIEARTYRLGGHYAGDPGHYRSSQELEEAQQDDPLMRVQHDLRTSGVSADDLERAQEVVEREVAEAARFASESPLPDPAQVSEHVLAGDPIV